MVHYTTNITAPSQITGTIRPQYGTIIYLTLSIISAMKYLNTQQNRSLLVHWQRTFSAPDVTCDKVERMFMNLYFQIQPSAELTFK